jgi:hypothetical protein
MKSRNIYRIAIGTLMFVSGIITIILTTGEAIIGMVLLVAGLAFLIVGITRHWKEGEIPDNTCPLNCHTRPLHMHLPDVLFLKRRCCVMPEIREAGLSCRRR